MNTDQVGSHAQNRVATGPLTMALGIQILLKWFTLFMLDVSNRSTQLFLRPKAFLAAIFRYSNGPVAIAPRF